MSLVNFLYDNVLNKPNKMLIFRTFKIKMEFFNPAFFISLFLISLIIPASRPVEWRSGKRNYIASGNVKCFDSETNNTVPFANEGVVLYEEDQYSTRKLNEGQTDGNGQFSVSGTGGESIIETWPYLYFVHSCGVPKCLSVTKVYFGSISVNESKDLKIILGTGKEEAKDGQGKALKMETINKGNEKCESTNVDDGRIG